MKKIMVIGSGGAGKSTFAVKLGQMLNIEVIHLDSLYWQPGWVKLANDAWDATLAALLAREAWIMDGNYTRTLALRLAACDTVIFLDLARTVCLWRILRRRLRYWHGVRPDMGAGCEERVTLEFARWVWDYPRRVRPKVLALLRAHEQSKRIIRLSSQAAVEKFLAAAGRLPNS